MSGVKDIVANVLNDIFSTQSLRIVFYSLILTAVILAIFLITWGYPVNQLVSGSPAAVNASISTGNIRHLAAIAFLPLFVLLWFILYLQFNSERDDLYSSIRKKLVGTYIVTYHASNGPTSGPALDPPLQTQCEIRINPQNKKLELDFKIKNNPVYTDGDNIVESVALRHNSGVQYDLMYYMDSNRYLKERITNYLEEDEHFSLEKGIQVKVFGLLRFEAGLDKSTVLSLRGDWFDLNGKVTQVFSLMDEVHEAKAKRVDFQKKSISEVTITLANFSAMMGAIEFERIV